LTEYAVKPVKATFVECELVKANEHLRAVYIVRGTDSEEVEEQLRTEYGLGKLKFVCCRWEVEDQQFGYVDSGNLRGLNDNYFLEIRMEANAEKGFKNGAAEIEFDRNKVEFTVTVQLFEI
jgi:hypothetical protein